MEVIGIHLVQTLAHLGTPRRSMVALVDAGGHLLALTPVDDDAALLRAVGTGAELVVVDAPLAVPGETGQRDLERVLAWCDIAVFPASARRLRALHGGMRGVDLAPALDAAAARGAWEASPDQVLRQLIWEREHPADAPAMDLADYRAAWPSVRAPVYRPKAAGRARPAGLVPAWRLVDAALDLGGWTPRPDGDDWAAIADAARIDALCCAVAGLRSLGAGGGAVAVGTPGRGRMLVPADANLAARIELTVDRMRAERVIRI